MNDGGVRNGRGWGRWDEGGEGGGTAKEMRGEEGEGSEDK